MSRSFLQAALALAAEGYRVFPCIPDGKEPAVPGGVHAATDDARQITTWWTERPQCNIGIAPGEKFWVLDIDDKPGKSGSDNILALETEHGFLPDTRTIRTPSGGYHRYYLGRAPSTASRICADVDTRGVGGYVLAPPSVVGGNPYTLLSNAPIAEPSPWLVERLGRGERARERSVTQDLDTPANLRRARTFLQSQPIPIEGQGSDADTYALACMLRDIGISPETSLSLLADFTDFDMEWIEEKVHHAWEYAANEAGAKGLRDPIKSFEGLKRIQNAGARATTKAARFKLYSMAEMRDEPDPSWLVQDVFPSEGVVCIYGPWGSLKSFAALDIAYAAATGAPFLGSRPLVGAPRTVVYTAGEGYKGIAKKRLPALVSTRGRECERNLYAIKNVPIVSDPAQIDEFCAAIDAADVSPSLFILDTYARMLAGLNENDAGTATLAISCLDALAERYNALVIVVAHAGKDDSKGMRGSTGAPAGFDTLIRMESDPHGKAPKPGTLTIEKQKDADPGDPVLLMAEPIHGSLVLRVATADEHAAASRPTDATASKAVGSALLKLAAIEPKSVTTTVLAHELCTIKLGEAEDLYRKRLAAIERTLNRKRRDELAGYVNEAGGWSLPAA